MDEQIIAISKDPVRIPLMYGGMVPSDAKRLWALEDETGKLKKMQYCEASIQKSGDACWEGESCDASDGAS
jgi:hypothetical protein